MIRLLLALSCLAIGCGGTHGPSQPTPVLDSLLAVAREWGESDEYDDAWTRAELDRIAEHIRRTVARDRPESRRAALNKTIFEELGFVREVTDTSLRFVLLPSVLKSQRGSCVGLGALYLALAEHLGWKLQGVMVPGHFFVRIHERDGSRNLELLRHGESMSDAWYRTRFPIPGGSASEYARPLRSAEVLGVIEYDAGNERRRQGRLIEARRAYEHARRHFPDFAEAHASLGAIAHLLGALDEARADYEAARRANPHLPGIDQNLDLLESERRPAPSR